MKNAIKSIVCCALIIFVALMIWSNESSAQKPKSQKKAAVSKLGNTDCLACHNNSELTKDVNGKQVSVHVNEAVFKESIHNPLNCTDCHTNVKDYPHDPAPAKVSCAECHTAADGDYHKGLHAKAVSNGSIKAANCQDCHGNIHTILPSTDPKSKVFRNNIPQTCGTCHGQKFVMEGTGRSAQTFFSYQESVHGKAVAAGSDKAAVCTDCHKPHDIRSASDPQSEIFKFNIPTTCGKCHNNETKEFNESIHGQAIARGNSQSPVCTDCHGIHNIKSHIDPNSRVAAQTLSRTTCGQCHSGVRLSQEFGVAGGRLSSYLDSYHGAASDLGSKVVANCASCHGVHNILPSTDPKSMVNKVNLVQTCGRCHPGAGDNFITGKIHHVDTEPRVEIGAKVNYWVRLIYLGLIYGVIGFMLLHNGLIFRKKIAAIRKAQGRSIVRLNRSERIQHVLLFTSFTALVLTGFALAYPNSAFSWMFGSSENIRRIGHRIAAVVMLVVGIYHLGYIFFTPQGRKLVRDFWPEWKDVTDLWQNMLYYLGLSPNKAMFKKFGYVEKAEYWAVVWGTVIMGVTGLMAWFKISVFGFVPRWLVDVGLTIHFYEAILATLAIIIWHFYHVIFDPDVYPISWTWLDGRVSAEHYKEEHPLDYDRAVSEAAGTKEEKKDEKKEE